MTALIGCIAFVLFATIVASSRTTDNKNQKTEP